MSRHKKTPERPGSEVFGVNNSEVIHVKNHNTAVDVVIPLLRSGEDGQHLVDARSLHRFLEVDAHFKDWIARRIAEYGFQEGEDFRSFLSKSTGGRPSREYSITLDTAKEMSMVERNEKGRQARRYFIECEKRLRAAAPQQADTIAGQTIGIDGFHVLGALVAGKVRTFPKPVQRRATMKMWAQVHAAFNVRSAEDIPSAQLDSARNFIAAYVLEGEWIEARRAEGVISFDDDEAQAVYLLISHSKQMVKMVDEIYRAGGALRSELLIAAASHLWEIKSFISRLDREKSGELANLHDLRMAPARRASA